MKVKNTIAELKQKDIALITEAAGHGFMECMFGLAYGKKLVACSLQTEKEKFEKETCDIYNRLSPFVSNMEKAKWEEAENLIKNGVSFREMLKKEQTEGEMWNKFAQITLTPKQENNLPNYSSVDSHSTNIMLIPQKLFSDGQCGLTAQQQCVPLEVFNFFKSEPNNQYILGQHFNKVNDLEHVENIAREFSMYVPGQIEDKEVFGIRGIPHILYLNLYKKTDISIGIVGTHTWYMLGCFSDKPQIILYNKSGIERWEEIVKPYQKQGKPIYILGFDENTDWYKFSLEIQSLYKKIVKK